MEFICYEVGQPYDKVMGGDGAIFEMDDLRAYINIGMTDMTEEERIILHSGKLDTYLSIIEGIIFISADFDGKLLFNMPFNVGLYESFVIPDPAPGGYVTPVIVVENRTNIIKAIRAIGFDPEFSAMLYKAALNQWEHRIENFDERLADIYVRYTPQDIIRLASRKNAIGNREENL